MIWNEEKENLERLINVEKKSYEEIGREYNVCGNTIKKQARKLGIELKPRREINPQETFNKGKNKEEKKEIIEEKLETNDVKVKNRKNLGEIGERIAIGELAKYGIDVLLPMSDNLPFDFVIFHNNKFFKCQVKTSRQISPNGSLIFSLTTNNWLSKKEYIYYKEEVDVFICCDLNTIYLFTFDEVENKKYVYLRYSKAKNNQINGVLFAHDYRISQDLIDKVLK
jgi:hypothetical protein